MPTSSVFSSIGVPRIARTRSASTRATALISHSQLLKESERRLAAAGSSGIPHEEMIASRLLANAALYNRWEIEHGALLGRIALERRAGPRRAALISMCLTLIHRKALFEFLRESGLRGTARADLVHRVLGSHEYSRLIVMEHSNYIRSAASYLCVQYLGVQVFRSSLFGLPLAEYEELYASYYQSCCETALLAADDPLTRYFHEVHASLKRQLSLRRSILLRCALHDTHPDNQTGNESQVDRRH